MSFIDLILKPRRPKLLLKTLGVALVIAGAVAAFATTSLGQRAELRTVDSRFAHRQDLAPPKDIEIVAIDRHQDTLINQWPLNRELYGKAITQLDKAGVAGIVIDVPMDYLASNPTTEDASFMKAVADSHVPVVLARRWTHDRPGNDLGSEFGKIDTRGDVVGLAGISARIPGADGAVREWPVRRDGERGGAAELLRYTGGKQSLEGAPSTIELNYYGPRGTFSQTSFADVAFGLSILKDLKGKLVLIGPTEGLGRDEHDTPVGRMSSVEIQANALANLMDRSWIRTPAAWVAPAAAVALAMLVWALLLTLPLGVSVPGSLAAFGGWWWLAYALFDRGVDVPLVAPLVAGFAVFTTLAIWLATVSVRERLRVKGLFARYVHPDVVRELIDSEDRIQLGGEQREITVMFTDIRGFTSMSEHQDPSELVSQLNEYFAVMVEVVTRHHGALDKFLGDGLMAIFGAPGESGNHAENACNAALEMLDRLEHVNGSRHVRGLAELRIGIGIHTGMAVVGNVGSPLFRVDFTAIGDTVNLAARLEATTKDLECDIVASGATVEAAGPDGFTFQPHGAVVVRGREAAVPVFALERGQARRAA